MVRWDDTVTLTPLARWDDTVTLTPLAPLAR